MSLDFRLSGADAFERRQMCEAHGHCYPCGKQAQEAVARMLRSAPATIQLVGDESYGRPVAIVSVDGYDVGERLIAQGLAVPLPRYIRNAPARSARYAVVFNQARRLGRGVHGGRWIEPARWRRGDRLACERR